MAQGGPLDNFYAKDRGPLVFGVNGLRAHGDGR